MPITLDGTLGVGTPGITLAGSAITASANQLNNASEDMDAENRIINGNFRIWQRGASSTAYGYVAADRWLNGYTGGTVTQSLQSFALGDTLGVNCPSYFLRQTVSGQTLATQYAVTVQPIENVRSYAGQTITMLGWARRSSGAGNMALEGVQVFGTGGSPSAEVNSLSVTTVSLTGAWAPFAVVLNIPSTTGKTTGTNNNDFFAVNIWTSCGSTNAARSNSLGLQTIGVDLWGIHIRVGTWTAADVALYRERDVGTELTLCQRYYCRAYNNNRFYATAGGQSSDVSVYWPGTMRAAPNVTYVSGSAPTNGASAVYNVTDSNFRHSVTSTAAGDCYQLVTLYAADAEL